MWEDLQRLTRWVSDLGGAPGAPLCESGTPLRVRTRATGPGGAMGREDWDLSHEYETHDHTGDDDREWFLEVISHTVLFLAAVGLFTLAPWILSFVAFVLGVVLAVLGGILKLVAGVLGLVISAIGLAVSIALKIALWCVAVLANPAVLLLIVLIVLAQQRR